MNRQLFIVLAAALSLCLILPAMGVAKMTRSESGSVSSERSMDRQSYRYQERNQDRQQLQTDKI